MMEHKRWKNPYIEKLQDLPDFIIACDNNSAREDAVQTVRQKCTAFSSVYVEIGSGSGMHLIGRALQDPESLYIGFELRYKRAYKTAEKAQRKDLTNLLVIRTNATLIDSFFSPGSLAGIYINFPDPWDKKRWQKHRIINPDYLGIVHRLLREDGFLSYKTDHREYFRSSLELIEDSPLFSVAAATEDLHGSEYEGNNVHTEFEKLFISKGLSPCYLLAEKISN